MLYFSQAFFYRCNTFFIPYCLKLWLVMCKRLVPFSDWGRVLYNKIKHTCIIVLHASSAAIRIQCWHHSITDYKWHVNILLINACFAQWPGEKLLERTKFPGHNSRQYGNSFYYHSYIVWKAKCFPPIFYHVCSM